MIQKMKEKKLVLILIVLIAGIGAGAWWVRFGGGVNQVSQTEVGGDQASTEDAADETERMEFLALPEHMADPDAHNLKLEIISPKEEVIFPGQARMYSAYMSGNTLWESAKIDCHWKFYVNENNEEVLYQQMENNSMIATGEKEVCGFTSTFMDKIGTVRVELTAELSSFAGEFLERVSTDREYVVAR